ncbi:MAG: phosphoenolpyruvate carboxylase, partial [Arenicellales bacterium]
MNNPPEPREPAFDEPAEGDARLRDDVRLLGGLLGETLISQEGRDLFELVERVRGVTKTARADGGRAADTLSGLLSTLPAGK